MTGRLRTITELIPGNSRGVIDVGTDHGYVPVALAKNGYAGKIIATDVHIEPLKAAIALANRENVSEKIDFRLADGLQGCSPKEADTVIIAGMGGDLICSIIDTAEWLCSWEYTLILQPMTRAEVLRYYLINNGWRITQEKPVNENGRLFHLFTARYQGMYLRSADWENPALTDAELFTGKLTQRKTVHKTVREAVRETAQAAQQKDSLKVEAKLKTAAPLQKTMQESLQSEVQQVEAPLQETMRTEAPLQEEILKNELSKLRKRLQGKDGAFFRSITDAMTDAVNQDGCKQS